MNYKHLCIVCAVALCCPLTLSAGNQDNDSIDGYCFVYEYTYPGRKKQQTDRQSLEVDPKTGISVFYSQYNTAREKVIKEMKAGNTADALTILGRINTMPSGCSWIVYKNLPQTGSLTYTDKKMGQYFKYTDPMPAINWT